PDGYPSGLPQVAPVAMPQARCLARNLSRHADEPMEPFRYRDKGSMATIGRNRAVVDMRGFHLSGRIAWFAWMFVHLMSLLGMRNRTVVFINWIWGYFTFSSGLRLLMRPDRYPLRSYWKE
ncbi:MAG: NAD(P)/FAD-dependent oxidoreductase, partial [Muribaculaceae bacterium]|nr:NAD(P)/FAD-dependent oxidoreductase [Muribaculaceae bacterium]